MILSSILKSLETRVVFSLVVIGARRRRSENELYGGETRTRDWEVRQSGAKVDSRKKLVLRYGAKNRGTMRVSRMRSRECRVRNWVAGRRKIHAEEL